MEAFASLQVGGNGWASLSISENAYASRPATAAKNVRPVTDRYREIWATTKRAAHEPHPLMAIGRHIVVAETREVALSSGKRGFDRWYASLQHLWRVHGNPMTHYPVPEDFMAAVEAGFVLAGTADDVAESLRREIETAGVNYVLTRFAFGNLSFEEELRSATLFAREVMPRFARDGRGVSRGARGAS